MREMERELATYFSLMWGIDVDNDDLATAKFPTFEEALGLLELAEARGEFFRGFGGLSQNATRGQELRAHLISLVAVYLEQRLRIGGNYHRALVDQLQDQRCLKRTAFISLNYDILIDNALILQGATGVDYAVAFSNLNNPRRPKATPLLKLHGSLNWLYCPTCNALDHYHGEKIAAQLIDEPHRSVCGRCQEPRVPIIIPPTFFKVMSNFYLQQIWKRAEEKLKEARRIIFCGYSFPDADMHIKYLLKRAEVNRSGQPPKVFIVNEHESKDDHEREMERGRYLRFFRNKGLVHWTKLSFEQFAANPSLVEKEDQWLR
jgi:NAD-dependent SIR2 family protein deacetylase